MVSYDDGNYIFEQNFLFYLSVMLGADLLALKIVNQQLANFILWYNLKSKLEPKFWPSLVVFYPKIGGKRTNFDFRNYLLIGLIFTVWVDLIL